MKKFFTILTVAIINFVCYAQEEMHFEIDSVSVVSFQRNTVNTGSLMKSEDLILINYGQEPSNVFKSMPSIISLSDNGTEFGYGYFRIRGLDQTRINVNLDGCPWNEAEDFGSYFANSPDLMSSMKSIKVERGSSASYNGVAGSAGGINLESIDVFSDSPSYAFIGGGSFATYKLSAITNTHNDKWGFHLKATTSGTDGYRDYGFNDSKALTAKIGYKINSNHTIDILTMNGHHRNGQGWIGNTLSELAVNPRANGNTKDEDDGWFMTMNRLQYRGYISDNTFLISSVYYQFQTGSYRMDLDNYMKRMVDPTMPETKILYDYGLTHHMAGANVMTKSIWKKITLSGGINAYNYNRKHFSGNKGKYVPEEEQYSNAGNKIDASMFIFANYKPIKELSLSANIQYRHVDFTYRDYLNQEVKFDSNKTKWNFLNANAVVEYTPINNVKIYGKYCRVNREPTRSDMFGGNEYYVGELTTITPETANDIELGVEGAFNKITFNVNFFYMWFNNELVLNGEFGLNGLPCHENANKSYRRGIEGTVEWNIFSNLHFNNNFSLSQNKVTTPTFGTKTHILTPSMTWDSNLLWRDKKWFVGANFSYRNEVFVDMTNEHKIPSMWTINLLGSVSLNRYTLGLNLNNITNRRNYCTGAVGANNETLYFAMAGFNFMANLKIYFGN